MLDRRLAKPSVVDADQTAIDALGNIASEPDLMKRFLDLTINRHQNRNPLSDF